MTASVLVVALGAPAFARGHVTPTPSPSPSADATMPSEDPAITQIARREFVAWQAGVVNPEHYSSKTRGLEPEKIANTSKALGILGSLIRTEWLGPIPIISGGPPDAKAYLFRMVCSNSAVFEELTIGGDGKIDGIFFRDKLNP